MGVKIDRRGLDRKLKILLGNVKSRKTFLKIGFFVIKTVKDRTRKQGQGVRTPNGRKERLKKVSEQWAKRRKKESRHPEAATGRASNLTFKGQLLDGMIVKRANSDGIFIGFKRVQDEKKAEGQAEQGRIFMNLSRSEIRSTSDFIKSQILKGL